MVAFTNVCHQLNHTNELSFNLLPFKRPSSLPPRSAGPAGAGMTERQLQAQLQGKGARARQML
jgi:hypothetical protein